MDAKTILMKAVEADKEGRILQAQNFYEKGIEILLNMVGDETDPRKKKVYDERIEEYRIRAEQIQKRIQRFTETGNVVAHHTIEEDSSGHSYSSLFGKYMNRELKEIIIEEPYLVEKYQFQNLIAFLELAVKECTPALKYVRLITKEDAKNANGQLSSLKQIKDDLYQRGITMSAIFDSKLHDRRIVLGSGYIIKIGRGLHYFKATNPLYSLGLCDHHFRKCRQTDVDIWQTKSFN